MPPSVMSVLQSSRLLRFHQLLAALQDGEQRKCRLGRAIAGNIGSAAEVAVRPGMHGDPRVVHEGRRQMSGPSFPVVRRTVKMHLTFIDTRANRIWIVDVPGLRNKIGPSAFSESACVFAYFAA